MQRHIEAMTHRGQSAGALQPGNSISLCFAEPAGLSLELDRIAAALMDGDDVWHAGARAQTFEDGGLYYRALPSVWDMEREDTWDTAPLEMIKHSSLYVVLTERRPPARAGNSIPLH
jgi:hypothetical protein